MVNDKSDPLLPPRAQFALWLSQQTPRKILWIFFVLMAMFLFIVALTYGVTWLQCVEADGWGQGRENVCVFNGVVPGWNIPLDQQPDAYNVRGIPMVVDKDLSD